MKTDDLISMLASDAGTVEPRVWQQRYGLALGAGVIASVILMTMLLDLRPDFSEATRLPMFWVKFAFPATLAAGALFAVVRLSLPGMQLGYVSSALAAPVLVIWLLGAIALTGAEPDERSAMIFGQTWQYCPVYVTILSMPTFVLLMGVMKTLAPTRLVLAGAAAGLLAGALGALVYALHCPEMDAPFLGVWYLLGMLIPTALGALIGPRWLKW